MRSEFYSLETLCRMHNVAHLRWTAFGNECTELGNVAGRWVFNHLPAGRMEVLLKKLAVENNA